MTGKETFNIVVTGGGSGIGRAVVHAAARRGWGVAVLDFERESASAAASEALQQGAPAAVGLYCDVRDEDSVASAVAEAAFGIGPLRGLVTSAGIERNGLVHDLDSAIWQDVLATNLNGTFFACKHFLRSVLETGSGGVIVCVSSPWADVAAPGGASAYCASKGAVSSFVRSLALDYAEHGVRVNAIVPGATNTPLMWANVPEEMIDGLRDKASARIALGRFAEPAEIAEGVAWLLSPLSAYMTGSHLVMDGGLLARAGIDD